MTAPQPATLDREKDKKERKARNGGLFVTDAELLRRLGVPEKVGYQALAMLDENNGKSGFPQKDPLWCGRRYWPAVRTYLDTYYQGKMGASPFKRNAA